MLMGKTSRSSLILAYKIFIVTKKGAEKYPNKTTVINTIVLDSTNKTAIIKFWLVIWGVLKIP